MRGKKLEEALRYEYEKGRNAGICEASNAFSDYRLTAKRQAWQDTFMTMLHRNVPVEDAKKAADLAWDNQGRLA